MDLTSREPLLEMFIFETVQLIEQLEELLIDVERTGKMTAAGVNEIFRIMHTIKGSSAMMMYDQVAALAHALEDLFDQIRTQPEISVDYMLLTDHVLQAADFVKGEIAKVEADQELDGNADTLISQVRTFQVTLVQDQTAEKIAVITEEPVLHSNTAQLDAMLNYNDEQLPMYAATITFEADCQMENMHAFTVVHNLESHVLDLWYLPPDILENEQSAEVIRRDGFRLYFTATEPQDDLYAVLDQTMLLDKLEFGPVDVFPLEINRNELELGADDASFDADLDMADDNEKADELSELREKPADIKVKNTIRTQSVISVHINKLDLLMDLVGELVISEAMVTHNPELDGLELDGFHKAARQLNKLTNELQDIVMSIRMVPVAATFHKMQRIVRDMTRKLGKSVNLRLIGEETEVDKSIIDQLADPLMHLIRNGLDHGIETPAERLAAGKQEEGTLTLEARNAGSDVWITIRDDGKGIDSQVILLKAKDNGLFDKLESEYSEKEILSFILLPGFSTKDAVSEFSGRGVGMDVVRENIEKIGGTINIESEKGKGTAFQIRIPLTLAIIDGMLLSVGDASYILPITAICESFRPAKEQIIVDSEGNEMLMIRGECINVLRLHELFNSQPDIQNLDEGILIMVEDDDQMVCLFADNLLGEQQAVVKPLPAYIRKTKGLVGCTILGDGSISLILDVGGLLS